MRRSSVLDSGLPESTQIDELTLKPVDLQRKWVVFFKVFAVLSALWTLLVLATETALIFGPEYTLIHWLVNSNPNATLSIFVMSVLFLSGITLNCLFSIFNLKISDYLQLREEQTDCVQMASVTGLISKIINVICFNYMVICGEVAVPQGDTSSLDNLPGGDQLFQSQFVKLYGSMLQTPFFGSRYNQIAPLLILIFSILFSALGLFKYNSRNLEALILFNLGRENQT